MAFPKIFNKLFKNAGAGPDLNEEIVTNVVRKTGTEEISGNKKFTDRYVVNKLLSVVRGTSPSENTVYGDFLFEDSENTDLAALEVSCRSAEDQTFGGSSVDLKMWVYKYLPYSAGTSPEGASLVVGWDKNDRPYASCPSTLTTRTYENDILTRDWIPKDTRIVHTTGDENIYGKKYFCGDSDSFTHFLRIKNNKMDRNGSVANNAGSSFNLVDKDNDDIASFGINQYTDGDIVAYMHAYNSSGSYISVGLTYVNNSFYPQTTKVLSLGKSGKLWTTVFANTTTISTSDERLKSNVSLISDNLLDVWGEINFVNYQLNDSIAEKGEDHARYHSGLIAQSIDSAFKKHNLDPRLYGFFCWDSWNETPEERDDDGNIVREREPAGEQYSLRYEEALCIEAAYQRRRASRAEERIAALEQKVAELERKTA